jgi:hypothetical protein
MYDDRDRARLEFGLVIHRRADRQADRRGLLAPPIRNWRLGWNTTAVPCIMRLAWPETKPRLRLPVCYKTIATIAIAMNARESQVRTS